MAILSEAILRWLNTMPELIHKADLMDKLRYMDNIHRKNIIRAYNDGWNNYIHKKRWNWKGDEYYERYYGIYDKSITRRTLQTFHNVRKKPKSKTNE